MVTYNSADDFFPEGAKRRDDSWIRVDEGPEDHDEKSVSAESDDESS